MASDGQVINLKCLSFVEKKTETQKLLLGHSVNVLMINFQLHFAVYCREKMSMFALSLFFYKSVELIEIIENSPDTGRKEVRPVAKKSTGWGKWK